MLEYLDIAIGFATIMLLLSLAVTAVVQVISSVFDLRGNNLVWALAKLFEQMPVKDISATGTGPDGKKKSQTVSTELALAVARDSSIAPGNLLSWYKAKAIRPDELQAIVQKLAAAPPSNMSEQAKAALQQLVSERVPGSGQLMDDAKAVAAELEVLFPTRAQAVRDSVTQIMGKTQRIAAEIDTWFDTVMDRSADRFARNSKIWSGIIGAALALAFQVNAVYIFLQISNNAGIRNQLVAIAQPTLQQAAQIQAQANVAGSTFSTMKKEEAYRAQLQNAPDRLATCSDGTAWISANVQNADAIAAEFERRCTQQQVDQRLSDLSKSYASLSGALDKTQLKLTGTPPTWKWYEELGGYLSTAILLGLGAPFWYNVLRQMATLRPPTSQKIREETQDSDQAETQPARAAIAGK